MANLILLQTKFLIPQLGSTHLSRPLLVSKICESKALQNILLVAPAGYGKTSLLTEVVTCYRHPLVWLQLDEGDNDPATFMAYLVEGFRRQFPETLLVNMQLDDSIAPEHTLIILLNQLFEHANQMAMLILDDYHVIHNPNVHKLMTTLIENLPSTMRVAISSRMTPALPLARWRVRKQLLEIRAEDLRFSQDETVAWLALQSRHLPEHVVRDLVEKTEGWGAALQLVSAMLDDDTANSSMIEHLQGSQPFIFDYLMDEVFTYQSQDQQLFLLQSSIFTELNPEICQAVLGIESAQDILLSLEKDGLFVSRLDQTQHWFRYHQLFRDFLVSRFRGQFPTQYIAIQARVGDYFATQGQSEKAVHHYLEANQYTLAIEMLLVFADDYIIHGRVEEIQNYLNIITPQIHEPSAQIQWLQARLFRLNGQLNMAIHQLQDIIQRKPDLPQILCQTYCELSAIYLSQGKYQEAYEVANHAVNLSEGLDVRDYVPALMQLASCVGFIKGMDEGHRIATEAYQMMQSHSHKFSDYDRANLLHMLGQICWWYGNVQLAISYCHRALSLLDEMDTSLKARLLITLSIPTLYQKDYSQALQLAEQAINICQDLQLKELMPAAHAALGNVLTRTGDTKRAELCLRTAIDQATSMGGARYSQVMAAGYLAQNLALQGRVAEAQEVVQSALAPTTDQPYVYDAYVCHSVLADMLLETNQLVEAKTIFNNLISIGEITQYRIPLAMAYFGLAYIMLQEHQQDQALIYSQQSIELLEPSMMHQLYLDQRQRALLICKELVQYLPQNNFVHQVYESLSASIKLPADMITIVPPDLIQVHTLGTLHVFHNHQEIKPKAFASAKARDLLAYFITLRTKSVNLDRAVNDLWSDDEGSTSAFHTALYRLRVALRTKGNKDKFILSEVGEYRLDISKFDIDIEQFDNLLRRANNVTDTQQKSSLYERALPLYKGAYLDNLYYDWVMIEREQLERQYLQAIDDYCMILIADAQYQRAIDWQTKALDIDLYNETLHVKYLKTLSYLGNQQKLIDHYARLKTLLADAFDAEPLPSTQVAYQQLISGHFT